MKHIILFLGIFYLGFHSAVTAQTTDSSATDAGENLLALLNSNASEDPTQRYTEATFKTTRIANGHSIENVGKGVLDFRINHRFGMLNQGIRDFFGLDNATTRIGADYGITEQLMIGVGRSTYLKDYDGFFKYKILRQTTNDRMPFSLSVLGSISIQTVDAYAPSGESYSFNNRLGYVSQLLLARKFSSAFSLQLMPTYLHYNLVRYRNDPNDIFSLGVGGRIKLTKRLSLTGEYYMLLGDRLRGTKNALSMGLDIETGGHVFQLLFTNAMGITEKTVIGQTFGDINKGAIHFGFNISRVFTIVKPKETEGLRNRVW